MSRKPSPYRQGDMTCFPGDNNYYSIGFLCQTYRCSVTGSQRTTQIGVRRKGKITGSQDQLVVLDDYRSIV